MFSTYTMDEKNENYSKHENHSKCIQIQPFENKILRYIFNEVSMMKKITVSILLMILFLIPISFGDVELTDEEQEWLENHPVISFAGDPVWPPIDFLDGNQKGLIVDYLNTMEEMLNIKIEYVELASWHQILLALENKEVDVIVGSYHDSRKDIMLFSDLILEIPYIIVSRNDFSDEVTLNNIHKKTVATVEGWILNTVLQDDHPGITLKKYPSVADALKAVSFGNVDIMVHELASVSYEIETQKITNLKYHSEYPRTVDVRFIIRKDYVILKSIIDKSLNEMSHKEKREIYNKWISLSIIPFYKQSIFYMTVTIIVIIVVLSYFWLKILQRQINIKTEALRLELEKSSSMQHQLEEALEKHNEMQREMILQERMASLGSMVAGISHEVNNPLGVCLTTVSAFTNRVDKIQRAYVNENLTKTQFVEFLTQLKGANLLVEENLQRAIQTLGSFKNMAINQMQDEKELINFCDFMTKLKETFKYELKKKDIQVDIICGDNIVFLGSPGSFSQIFTNLILNSLIHGFVEKQVNYKIQIKSAIIERVLVIEYSDNGIGIPEALHEDVFKLFFTTKRQQGGSGIGLHIVKNLLKEKFNGSITCDNSEEKGVVFTLSLPITNH